MLRKMRKPLLMITIVISIIILGACGFSEHTISFNTGLGSDIDPITDYVGSAIVAPANPTKDGHNFVGWNLDGVRVTFPLILNRDKVLVAVWEEILVTPQFTLSFNTGFGSDIEPITDYFGTTLSAPSIPTKEGFNFIGWNLDGARITFPLILNRDKVLVAVWEAIELTPRFTVSFNTGLGSDIDPITDYVGSAIVAPTAPVREGFDFVAWELNGVRVTFPLMLNQDMVFVAIWQTAFIIPSFTVSFNTGLGSNIAPITNYYGTMLEAPVDPTRDAFTFAGWYLNGIRVTFPLALNYDKVLVAAWDEILAAPRFTISLNDGVSDDAYLISDYAGAIIYASWVPTKEGFSFIGWNLDGTKVAFPLMLNRDKTLVAIWEPIFVVQRFTITFDTGLGSNIDDITDYAGSIINGPINPTKQGYTFVGWEMEGIKVSFPLVLTSDAEMRAVWLAQVAGVAIVTLNANEGIMGGPTEITTRIGQAINKPAIIPTRNGHTFVGWFYQGDKFDFNTLISADIVLYANWQVGTPGLIYNIIDEEVTITGYSGDSFYIVIPSTIDDYPVVAIESGAFQNLPVTNLVLPYGLKTIGFMAFFRTRITDLVIPSTVTLIDDSSFSNISTLSSVTLNEGLQTIGWSAFSRTSIKEIIIPSTVTSIGNGAFSFVTTLTSVSFNYGLQVIGNHAFEHTRLTEINIPSSVTIIDGHAFGHVSTLTNVVLNVGLQTIGAGAFTGTRLVEVVIPSSVLTIGSDSYQQLGAFSNISTLKNVTLNEGLLTIGTWAFEGTAITEIIIPSSVISVDYGAFNSISTLKNVTLNEGLHVIGERAFSETSLTEVIIPSSVISIGNSAFRDVITLTDVTFNEGLQTIGPQAFVGTRLVEVVIPSSVLTIGNDEWWMDRGPFSWIPTLVSVTLNEGLQTIGNGAFRGTSLIEMVIPSSVISIGADSFRDVSTLTSLTLNEGLQTINASAFIGTSITKIVIPSTVSWGLGSANPFANIPNLNVTLAEGSTTTHSWQNSSIVSIYIPSSVLEIESFAFRDVSTLTQVNLNEGLLTIGTQAFFGTGLSEIEVPKSVTSIARRAFEAMGDLKILTVPFIGNNRFSTSWWGSDEARLVYWFGLVPDRLREVNVTDAIYIENKAFYGLAQIEVITLNEGLQAIRDQAFMGTNITEIIIPASVSSWGWGAFNGVTTLSNVYLSEGLAGVGWGSFSGTSITKIVIPSSVVWIGPSAFAGSSALKSVTLNEGLQSIFYWAFEGTGITEILIPSTATLDGPGPGNPFIDIPNLNVILAEGSTTTHNWQGTQIASIYIPSTVVQIPLNAFDDVETLKIVTFNEGLQTIESQAFRGTSLTELILPSTITKIGSEAFDNVTTLTSVTLNEGLHTINDNAFQNTRLGEIVIPSSVISSWSYFTNPFRNISNLSVILADGTTTTHNWQGTQIASIYLPSSIYRIDANSFSWLITLTNVTFSEGLLAIDNNSFRGTRIEEVDFPASLTSIGDWAFAYAHTLTSVKIQGNQLLSIGQFAFWDTGITQIYIPDTVLNIAPNAFPTNTLITIIITQRATVIFDTKLGSNIDPITDIVGRYIQEPAEPTKVGHLFKGWQLDNANVIFPLLLERDKTLVAIWDVDPDAVTYRIDFKGVTITPFYQMVTLPLLITLPTMPTREEHKFVGWLHNGVAWDFDNLPESDMILVASWVWAGGMLVKPAVNVSIPISTWKEFMSYVVNNDDQDLAFHLTNDICFEDAIWPSSSGRQFVGTLDGMGFYLKNIAVVGGIFYMIREGMTIIRNIGVDGAYITARAGTANPRTAVFARQTHERAVMRFENITIKDAIVFSNAGNEGVGALVARFDGTDATVRNVKIADTILHNNGAGGRAVGVLFGRTHHTVFDISDVYIIRTQIVGGERTGGLIGQINGMSSRANAHSQINNVIFHQVTLSTPARYARWVEPASEISAQSSSRFGLIAGQMEAGADHGVIDVNNIFFIGGSITVTNAGSYILASNPVRAINWIGTNIHIVNSEIVGSIITELESIQGPQPKIELYLFMDIVWWQANAATIVAYDSVWVWVGMPYNSFRLIRPFMRPGDNNRRHLITFDTGLGPIVDPIHVYDLEQLSLPDDPYLMGYHFIGWTLWGLPFEKTMPINDSLILVAEWQNNQARADYVIQLIEKLPSNDDMLHIHESQVRYANEAFVTLSDTQRCLIDITLQNRLNDALIRLEVVLTQTYFSIEFDTFGHGDLIDDLTLLLNSRINLPTAQADGKIFMGWYTDIDLVIPFTNIYLTADIRLYAFWVFKATPVHVNIKINGALVTWDSVNFSGIYLVEYNFNNQVFSSIVLNNQYVITHGVGTLGSFVIRYQVGTTPYESSDILAETLVDELSILNAALANMQLYRGIHIQFFGGSDTASSMGVNFDSQVGGISVLNRNDDLTNNEVFLYNFSRATSSGIWRGLTTVVTRQYHMAGGNIVMQRRNADSNFLQTSTQAQIDAVLNAYLVPQWPQNDPTYITNADFESRFLRNPFDLILYTIDYLTINSITQALTFEDGEFIFSFDMDTTSAIIRNAPNVEWIFNREVIDYTWVSLSFRISQDMRLISYSSDSRNQFPAPIGIETRSTNSTFLITHSHTPFETFFLYNPAINNGDPLDLTWRG